MKATGAWNSRCSWKPPAASTGPPRASAAAAPPSAADPLSNHAVVALRRAFNSAASEREVDWLEFTKWVARQGPARAAPPANRRALGPSAAPARSANASSAPARAGAPPKKPAAAAAPPAGDELLVSARSLVRKLSSTYVVVSSGASHKPLTLDAPEQRHAAPSVRERGRERLILPRALVEALKAAAPASLISWQDLVALGSAHAEAARDAAAATLQARVRGAASRREGHARAEAAQTVQRHARGRKARAHEGKVGPAADARAEGAAPEREAAAGAKLAGARPDEQPSAARAAAEQAAAAEQRAAPPQPACGLHWTFNLSAGSWAYVTVRLREASVEHAAGADEGGTAGAAAGGAGAGAAKERGSMACHLPLKVMLRSPAPSASGSEPLPELLVGQPGGARPTAIQWHCRSVRPDGWSRTLEPSAGGISTSVRLIAPARARKDAAVGAGAGGADSSRLGEGTPGLYSIGVRMPSGARSGAGRGLRLELISLGQPRAAQFGGEAQAPAEPGATVAPAAATQAASAEPAGGAPRREEGGAHAVEAEGAAGAEAAAGAGGGAGLPEGMASYSGPTLDGLPTGSHGSCVYADGSTYAGGFWFGRRSGTGVFSTADGGGSLSGQWREDMPWRASAQGEGAFVSNDAGSGVRAVGPSGWVAEVWRAGSLAGVFDGAGAGGAAEGAAGGAALRVFRSREEAEAAFAPEAARLAFSHRGAILHGRRHGYGRSDYRDGCYLEGLWVADQLAPGGAGQIPLQLGTYSGQLAPSAPPPAHADAAARGARARAHAAPRLVPEGAGAYTHGPSALVAELDARARLTPLGADALSAVLESDGSGLSSSSALQLADAWRSAQAAAESRPGGAEGEADEPRAPQARSAAAAPRTAAEAGATAAPARATAAAGPATPNAPKSSAAAAAPDAPQGSEWSEAALPPVPRGGSRLVCEWRAGRPQNTAGGGGADGSGGACWWRHAPTPTLVWWYRGGWLGGLRHGVGMCVFYERAQTAEGGPAPAGEDDDGGAPPPSAAPIAAFSGEWRHGRWDGRGTLHTFAPARTLSGDFRGGLRFAAVRAQLSPGRSLYTGELGNGLRAGVGMSVERSGSDASVEYVGEWLDDLPHGAGARTDADGTYEGSFEHGLPHGRGALRRRSGAAFRGTWVRGVMEGRGRALPAQPARGAEGEEPRRWTEGVWVGGHLDLSSVDSGSAPLEGGGVYDGGLEGGLPHGKGRAHWPNGDTLEACWAHGELDPGEGGICVRTAASGDRYVGELRGGSVAFPRPHGYGALTAANGDRCEGKWRDGMPLDCDGAVTIEGQRYEGAWRGGVRSGRGRLRWPSGDEYEGQFEEGLPHGRGEHRYADGSSFRGLWRRGVPHGRGRLAEPDGRVVDAQWGDGRQLGQATASPTPAGSEIIYG